MAKADINRLTGYLGPRLEVQRREHLDKTLGQIDIALRTPREKTVGARNQAIEAYKKGGRNFAYSVINLKFKISNGEPAYSNETIDKWIDEYEENRKRARDDDDAR